MVSDRVLAKALLLVLPMCLSLAAHAAESEETMKSDAFVFTPRIWFGTYVSPKELDSLQTQDSFLVPMAGGTFTYAPKAMPDLAFLATFLHGSGEGRLIDLNVGATGTTASTRTDVEFLARYNLVGPKLYLLGGWRHVKFSVDDRVGAFSSTTDVTVSGPELGVGSTLDLSTDGRHQLFGNFIGLYTRYKHDYRDNAGFTERRSFPAWAMDMNVGYQFWLTHSINFSARYRIFNFYYEGTVGGPNGVKYKDLAVFHGPEIGASFAF
jgi:hypothetical protein